MRKLRRFTDTEGLPETQVEIKSSLEVHIHQTDCFSFLYNTSNRICGTCKLNKECNKLTKSSLNLITQLESDYKKVYHHKDATLREATDEFKDMYDVSKIFTAAYLDDGTAVIVLPITLYSENGTEIFELLGIKGKNYANNLQPFLRSDFGLLTIKTFVPMLKKETEACIIKITQD